MGRLQFNTCTSYKQDNQTKLVLIITEAFKTSMMISKGEQTETHERSPER